MLLTAKGPMQPQQNSLDWHKTLDANLTSKVWTECLFHAGFSCTLLIFIKPKGLSLRAFMRTLFPDRTRKFRNWWVSGMTFYSNLHLSNYARQRLTIPFTIPYPNHRAIAHWQLEAQYNRRCFVVKCKKHIAGMRVCSFAHLSCDVLKFVSSPNKC